MKKLHAIVSALALTVAGTMSAVTGSPFVEEPGEGTQSVWSRSSMCITSLAGIIDMTDPDYGGAVTMVTADDGTVWIDYLLSGFGVNGWATGTIDGDKLTLSLPQEIYREGGRTYMLALCSQNASGDYLMLQENEAVFNKVGTMWKSQNLESSSRFLGIVSSDGSFMGAGDYDIDFVPFEAPEQPGDEGVKYEPYNFIYGNFGNFCEIGHGEDGLMYIKGLVPDAPDTYITGNALFTDTPDTPGTLTLEAGQYLGVTKSNASTPHHCFFMPVADQGSDFVGLAEMNFDIYEAEEVISSKGIFVINYTDDPENLFYTTICANPKFTPTPVGQKLIPANPLSVTVDRSDDSIMANIPLLSTTGALLDSDNLYYMVYVDDALYTFFQDEYKYLDMEEMTEVPYNYTEEYDFIIHDTYHVVYLYTVGYEKVGVQCVYYGEGGPTYSDIVNSDGTVTKSPLSVAELNALRGQAQYFDLQGRPVSGDAKGLLLKRAPGADGTLRTVKVVR